MADYNYPRLLKLYFQQTQHYSTTAEDRMSFKGPILYSYRSKLAYYDKPGNTLMLDHHIADYSVTTKRHVTKLQSYLPPNTQVFRIDLNAPSQTNLQLYWDRIAYTLTKYKRARLQRTKNFHANNAKQLYKIAMDYANYANTDKRTKVYKYHTKIMAQLFEHKLL
jgi:hypothetical protein